MIDAECDFRTLLRNDAALESLRTLLAISMRNKQSHQEKNEAQWHRVRLGRGLGGEECDYRCSDVCVVDLLLPRKNSSPRDDPLATIRFRSFSLRNSSLCNGAATISTKINPR